MNGSIFSGIPLNTQANYGRTLLYAPRNTPLSEQKTVRIMGFSTNLPEKELEPTIRAHTRRPTPYERPTKNEMNKPIRITKSVTTTVEIDNPSGYISQDLLVRGLGITNGENIYQIIEDEPTETIEIKVKDGEIKPENQIKTEKI